MVLLKTHSRTVDRTRWAQTAVAGLEPRVTERLNNSETIRHLEGGPANELENRHPPQSAPGPDWENDHERQSGARKRAQISRDSLAVSANSGVPATAAFLLARAGQGMGAARVGGTRILLFDASRVKIPLRAIGGDGCGASATRHTVGEVFDCPQE